MSYSEKLKTIVKFANGDNPMPEYEMNDGVIYIKTEMYNIDYLKEFLDRMASVACTILDVNADATGICLSLGHNKVVVDEFYNSMPRSTPRLVIIRGAPGSGKTTMAKMLTKESGKFFELDQFWSSHMGDDQYHFDMDKLETAIQAIDNSIVDALLNKVSPIVISNTATRRYEYERYVLMAAQHGYQLEVMAMESDFTNGQGVPEKGVTPDKVATMKTRFELHNLQYMDSKVLEKAIADIVEDAIDCIDMKCNSTEAFSSLARFCPDGVFIRDCDVVAKGIVEIVRGKVREKSNGF